MSDILIIGCGKSSDITAEEVMKQGANAVRLVLPDEDVPDALKGILLDLKGTQGNFTAEIERDGDLIKINAGAVVVAIDEIPKISDSLSVPLSSLNTSLPNGTIVMLLNAKKPSRSSHIVAVHQAIKIKNNHPESKIYIITPEVRTFGLDELEYCEAQKSGIVFIRAEKIIIKHGTLKVTDSPSGKVLNIKPDILVTDEEQEVKNGPYWSKALSIALYEDGHFRLGNVSRGPVSSIRKGIFLCGTASRALLPREMDTSARAAATRAVTASKNPIVINSAEVDGEKCAACMTCVRSCLFQAPFINYDRSEIRQDLCQACGLCVNLCPVSAISLKGVERIELNTSLDEAMRCFHD